jgi:hypothetical protein
MGRSRVRLLVPLALLVLLVVGLALSQAGGAGSRYPTNGPLPLLDGAGIEIPAAAGTLLSWGMSLPGDPGGEIVLEAIEPVSVQGVEVLETWVCRWSGVPDADGIYNDCAPASSRTWPPPDVVLTPVAGTVLAADTMPFVSMVIGVRVESPGEGAGIDGIRIVYTSNGRTYEVVEQWELRVTAPAG